MGYHSRTRIYIGGDACDVQQVLDHIESMAKVLNLPFDSNVEDRVNLHWSDLASWPRCEADYGSSKKVVKIDSPSWFKAYDEWDRVVERLSSVCTKFGVNFSYAKMGEYEDDFTTLSNLDDSHYTIYIARSFDTPSAYVGLL